MTMTRAAIPSLLCATLTACGGAERTSDAVAPSGSGSAALSSNCSGLVPANVPPGFSTEVLLSDACSATGATSDGLGDYAYGRTCGNGFERWSVINGTGAGPAFRTTLDPANERDERHLFAQPGGGFLALHWVTDSNASGYHRVVSLRAFSGAGAQTGEHFFIDLIGATFTSFPDRSWSIAPLRPGGVQVSHVSQPGDGSWHLYTQRFSSSGAPADGVQQLATAVNSSIPQNTLTGVANGGEALIAWDNGTEGRAVWTDARGHLLGGTFSLPFHIDRSTAMSALLDGSIALRVSGQWTSVIAPGSHAAAPAPSWLSTRPGSDLFVVRGGRGHALFTQPPAGSCQAHVVLFAPSGIRCGAVDLRSGDPDGCATRGEVGQDGTVAVQGRTETYTDNPFPQQRVSQRFFPQLLQ
jgi:hypothetical protein